MKTDNQDNPILAQYSEQGFIDCVFRIVDPVETDNAYQFRMLASYDGQPVGIGVSVVKGIQSGLDADTNLIDEHVYR